MVNRSMNRLPSVLTLTKSCSISGQLSHGIPLLAAPLPGPRMLCWLATCLFSTEEATYVKTTIRALESICLEGSVQAQERNSPWTNKNPRKASSA
ncbi:hypothetical protein KBZ12_11085 [Cyanobium sp. Cruz CV13-4-11]|jgi:hypothetical protein|uniref:hypothetical protein n=1 Tax=unclassified Cyanobium TaxID=2627006 RepID=UPI0020CB8A61|nr:MULTISPECIES: hypothetical protein [unclassified Cyanobium]MCP9901920.1 hypothetical protein [Cyanobium sp. Cruz CV11-17]MCP9920012.1 hypothetical protein [Cyanobium sp. Cruz CV13-4-11]